MTETDEASMTSRSGRITRIVSESTGLSQEEIGVLVAATVAVTALLGVMRVVDAVIDVWPTKPRPTSE